MANVYMPTPPYTPTLSTGNFCLRSASRPIHMMLDFDGTITAADTTCHIANFACNLPSDPYRRDLRSNFWVFCCSEYVSALAKHPLYKSSTPGEIKGMEQEIQCHRSLRSIEEESISRCGEAGIFYGVSGPELSQAGWTMCQNSKVKLRDGFSELVGRLENYAGGKSRWGIVSVSWSRDFLRGVIGFALGSAARGLPVPVLSNEINPASGLIALLKRKCIVSSDDKLAAMKSMRDSFAGSVAGRSLYKSGTEEEEESSRLNPLVVYVGDSLTDLECLLEAEVGIVISVGGKSRLMEMLRRENYSVCHISAWVPHKEKTLWHARDFQDINCSALFQQPLSAAANLRHGSG